MAVLSDANRALLHKNFMADRSSAREALPLLKTDLRAAINAIDQWVDGNAAAFNSAIPLPARTALTAAQKANLLLYIVRRRFEVS